MNRFWHRLPYWKALEMQKRNVILTPPALANSLRYITYKVFIETDFSLPVPLLQIHFDQNGAMLGATISQFLLEKARVVQPPPGELNYAIFYTLVEGCDTPFRRALGLNSGVHNYKLLRPANGTPSGVDPAIEVNHFRAVVASFSALGLEKDMQFVFEVLAAILHLGNILSTLSLFFLSM